MSQSSAVQLNVNEVRLDIHEEVIDSGAVWGVLLGVESTVLWVALLLDDGFVIFFLDCGHGGLVKVEEGAELTGGLRTVQGLVGLTHGLVLVLGNGDLGVLDIGVGVPLGEHDGDAVFLLLDADVGFLGFIEQRVDASLVAAFIGTQAQYEGVEACGALATREKGRGYMMLGIEEQAVVLDGFLHGLGEQLYLHVAGFLFLVVLGCHSVFSKLLCD